MQILDCKENSESLIILFFEKNVGKWPDSIALSFKETQFTYQELDTAANKMANQLIAEGITPGTLVGLYLPRSPEQIISILAIMKAGCAYMPLDEAYPLQRIQYMLDVSDCRHIISNKILSPGSAISGINILDYQNLSTASSAQPGNKPLVKIDMASLAYVIFTSGSTGQPKGVAMPYKALANLADFQIKLSTEITNKKAKTLQFTPLIFDVSVQEIFSTLCGGGRLLLIDETTRRDPNALCRYLSVHEVERLFLPYVALQQLALAANELNLPLKLKEVISAGEQLLVTPAISRFFKNMDGCILRNQYGPTETHVIVTNYTLSGNPDYWPEYVPIGKAIPGAILYVADDERNSITEGKGDLYIGGISLANGYINSPDLSAEAFIPNPFGHGTVYKSGDYVQIDATGCITYLGRKDKQIKIRGFRIEPLEIETVLLNHPLIRNCIITADEDSYQNKRLLAYIVTADKDLNEKYQGYIPPSDFESSLRDFILSLLPEYMLPSFFTCLTNIPYNESGKTDFKALPAPGKRLEENNARIERNLSENEKIILDIWQDILKINNIGIQENFFYLGGHSILAIQIVNRIFRDTQIKVSLADIFQYKTIEALAGYLGTLNSNEHEAIARFNPLTARDRALNPAQEGLWFLYELQPESTAYHINYAITIKGKLEVSLLEKSIFLLINKHEILRSCFRKSDGKIYPIIKEESGFSLDLTIVDEDNISDNKYYNEILNLPFNLQTGPLFRAKLFKCNNAASLNKLNGEYILLLNIHHIISDGRSLEIIEKEIFSVYQYLLEDRNYNPTPADVCFYNYAAWENTQNAYKNIPSLENFWRKTLEGAIFEFRLPFRKLLKNESESAGHIVKFELPVELCEAIKEFAQKKQATLFSVYLSVYYLLLYRYSGQDDLIIGTVIQKREHSEIEDTIGYFVDYLPLRIQIPEAMNFISLLETVNHNFQQAFTHRTLPFEKIVQLNDIPRSVNVHPVFQASFVYNIKNEIAIPDLAAFGTEIHNGSCKLDLSLQMLEEKGKTTFTIEYKSNLYDEDTIKRMCGHFETLLQGFVASPETEIEKIPILTHSEINELLLLNNAETVQFDNLTIAQKFSIQTLVNPQNIAVTYQNSSLTYYELDKISNRLAHKLVESGASEGKLIGLFTGRSLEMIVGILAILKSGAAYLPLDPAYPADRLSLLMIDSATEIIIGNLYDIKSLPAFHGRIIPFTATQESYESYPDKTPEINHNPAAPAYIIYTSGTTGKPKGCLIKHSSILHLLESMQKVYHFTNKDSWTVYHSFAFDYSVFEIWGALLYGGRAIVVPFETSRDPQRFYDLVQKERVTVLNLTPAAFKNFLNADVNSNSKLSLKYLNLAAEILDFNCLNKWFEKYSDTAPIISNLYGITETTVFVSYKIITKEDAKQGGSYIGMPFPGYQVYITDKHQQLVPIGVPGELLIGGEGLAIGYFGDKNQTNKKFIASSPDGSQSRLYRSGDLVTYHPATGLDYLGRIDQQLKIRGYRIEPAEIEAVLSAHPDIKAAIILAIEDKAMDKRLAAYFIPESNNIPSNEELRRWVLQSLPFYMAPSWFIPMDKFPLTHNGKYDKKNFPMPNSQANITTDNFTAAPTAEEATLLNIWRELLLVNDIGFDDNFFQLGGDSLMSVSMVSQAVKMGLNITLYDFFMNQDIRRLASVSTLYIPQNADKSIIPISKSDNTPPIYFIPAGKGNYKEAMKIAYYLGTGFNFNYALPLLNEIDGKYISIEDLAAHYVKSLLTLQPEGPFFLAGFCFGGIVAYEMCRLLEQAGREVAYLFMFDSYTADAIHKKTGHNVFYRNWKKLKFNFSQVKKMDSAQRVEYLQKRFRKGVEVKVIRPFVKRVLSSKGKKENQEVSKVFINLNRTMYLAMEKYHYQPYHGNTVIIKATHIPGAEWMNFDPELGWKNRLTGKVIYEKIDTDHENLLKDPYIGEVAGIIKKYLSEFTNIKS